ncbi:hypothetical protein OFO01_07410 [Campylobacter sp. JMF_01 NE2]|uniref:hypothetical protein n=1 Tax=unclassified Campylobacter TaxID=2593542 RepID=UPI0022E9BC8A|nr:MULTISPECIES: hypothetical protein [unclassified Campylobacter]MDA3053208.1 hypothetical protein [Campylobacter sp. JMF_03 NE3]MDA3067609.1 hypothetical protein [Campylobacter sp. JMF_01 NE2]
MKTEKLYMIYNAVFCDLINNNMEYDEMKDYVLNKVNGEIFLSKHHIKADEFDRLFHGKFLDFHREIEILEKIFKYYTRNFTIFQLVVCIIETLFKCGYKISDKDLMEFTSCKQSDIDKAYKALRGDDFLDEVA